jgi:hypothetical protein
MNMYRGVGKGSRYPLERRLGGPQNLSGSGGEEKNSQPPPTMAINNVITATEMSAGN